MARARDRWPCRVPRGVSLAMSALLTPVLVGFLAVSVDTALLATGRNQLRTAADAGALAGAVNLIDQYNKYGTSSVSTQIASAQAQARAIGQSNKVLGQASVFLDNASNSASGDVVVGYVNPTTRAWTPPPLSALLMPNSVRVNGYRNANHSGDVALAFGKIYGFGSTSITNIQSTASAWAYSVKGFDGNKGSVHLLPIVLHKDNYNAMMAGTTTDEYSYNPLTNAVTSGSDGITESRLYPIKTGNPGNWGTINVGVSNNSTSTVADQIRYGITPAQMATYPNSKIELDTSLNPPSLTFDANPGISAGLKDDLESIIGDPVTIPIYDNSGDNGNNAWYRVVAFAPARVVDVNFQDGDKYVIVQPAIIRDASAIEGVPQSTWEKGGVIRMHLSQ